MVVPIVPQALVEFIGVPQEQGIYLHQSIIVFDTG